METRTKSYTIAGIIAIALIAMTVTPAVAQTLTCPYDICVNETGWWRDGGEFHAVDYPLGNPYGTDALNIANEGETVFVYNGTYRSEWVVIRKPNITLKGEGADVVTIDGGCIEIYDYAPGSVVEGFTVINRKVPLRANAPDCIIRNCVFDRMIGTCSIKGGL